MVFGVIINYGFIHYMAAIVPLHRFHASPSKDSGLTPTLRNLHLICHINIIPNFIQE